MTYYLEKEFFNVIRDRYYRNVKRLGSFSKYVLKHTDKHIRSDKLKSAAKRINIPYVFEPYKIYCEDALNVKIPANLSFTVDDVIAADKKTISSFQEPGTFTNISYNKFILCGIQAAIDLGILREDMTKYRKTTILQSVKSFERGTSSSYPVYERKGSERAQADAIAWVSNYIQHPSIDNIMSQPTTVFHRFQLRVGDNFNDYTKKIRAVWGISFRILVLYGIYFRSLVEGVKSYCVMQQHPASPLGRTKYDISRTIIQQLRNYTSTITSLDFSNFDSTISQPFFALFHAILYNTVDLSTDIEFDEDGMEISQNQRFGRFKGHLDDIILDHIMYFDCFTPYCWMSNKLQFQQRGNPSGSLLTTVFNTWVTRTLINYATYEYTHGHRMAGSTSVCLGDDLIFAEVYVTKEHVLNVASRFGFTVNADKSDSYAYWADFEFLGYKWNSKNEPYQSINWYVAHLIMPSRFFKDTGIPVPLLQTYRGISICMQLKGGINTFEQLVGWADPVWHDLKRQYRDTGQATIIWISENANELGITIPLSLIYSEGWKAF